MKKRKLPALAGTIVLAATLCSCTNIFNEGNNEIKVFTGYFAINGEAIDENNDIKEIIAKKTGAKCDEVWKSANKSFDETIDDMIISRRYPDFIYGGVGQQKLLDADALIPINEYWDEYENIKNYFTADQWEKLEDENGYIHYIPVYSNNYMNNTDPEYSDEAFWIQVKVLEWAGYPQINTLNQYFELIENYLKENPVNEDGEKYIGYEILTDDYLYFCMENPPQFLDGYPNDGGCIVDPDTLTALDYDTTPTAQKWFRKLNEEYHRGIIDPEFSFMTSAQYYEKIKSGLVLGMADQHWNFEAAESELPADSQYVPLDLVISEDVVPHYKSADSFDTSQGLGISVDCEDVESALKFIDDLLSPEIMTLRFWGVEGQDYIEDESGKLYRNDAQRSRSFSTDYQKEHFCSYSGFPFYGGMSLDGINAYCPENQPDEYFNTLGGPMKRCLEAYGVKTVSELLNADSENPPWFPVWTYTNRFTDDTDYGRAKQSIDSVKHRYLPKVIMSSDFDAAWDEYMDAYKLCDTGSYFNELTAEVRRRCGK